MKVRKKKIGPLFFLQCEGCHKTFFETHTFAYLFNWQLKADYKKVSSKTRISWLQSKIFGSF